MIAMRTVYSTLLAALRVRLLPALLLLATCAPNSTPMDLPVPPPETAFTMPDGARLPYRAWLPDGREEPPWAVVLALHGMNDSRDAWDYPAPAFADAGIAVFAPDQRGFGATAQRGLWPGEAALTADATEIAAQLRARYPKAKLILMGESMGAAVLMLAATSKNPPPADGYVLLAPAVWGRAQMNVFVRSSLWMATNFFPGLAVSGNAAGRIASDNRDALIALGRNPLTIKATRFQTVGGVVDLMDAALDAAPRFNVPALLMYGGKDDIIPARATRATWSALPPGPRRAFYPVGYHLLLRDLGRAVPIGDILAWIRHPDMPLPAEDAATRFLATAP